MTESHGLSTVAMNEVVPPGRPGMKIWKVTGVRAAVRDVDVELVVGCGLGSDDDDADRRREAARRRLQAASARTR